MAHTSSTAQHTVARFPLKLLRRICEYLGQLHALAYCLLRWPAKAFTPWSRLSSFDG